MPLSMIVRVSTTCCFLPWGSAGTEEASLRVELPRLASVRDVRWDRSPWADEKQCVRFRARPDEWCGLISADATASLSRLHHDSNNKGWPWDPVCGPALLGDRPGSLKADLSLEDQVEETDDEGHGRALAAPAHHRVAHSRGVVSRYATQLLDIPVACANWLRVQLGCKIIKRRRLARAA